MKIIVDAFGGDNAPLEIIKGCIEAKKEFGVDIMLTGDRDKIEKCAKWKQFFGDFLGGLNK